MSTPSTSLVTLLAALTATRTPADAAAAAGALYEAVRPVFIPVCEAVLRRAPGAPWLTAEDWLRIFWSTPSPRCSAVPVRIPPTTTWCAGCARWRLAA